MRTTCTILYNKFDFQFKKDVDREPPTGDGRWQSCEDVRVQGGI